MNVACLVLERARREPDASAIQVPAGRDAEGRAAWTGWTLGQLDAESGLLARGLAEHGIGRGVRTALMVRPSLELFGLTLALFRVGAVPVLIDPGIGVRRMGGCLAEAEPEAFIGVPAAHAARRLLGWGRRSLRAWVTVGGRSAWGGTRLSELREVGRNAPPRADAETGTDELAAILFTSGSTGPPKGVEYSHGHFVAQVEAIRGLGEIAPGEVDLPTFPLFALFDPALGMSAVVPDMDPTRPGSVDPRVIHEAAERFGASNLFGSPALLDTVGRHGERHGVRFSSLRRVISAGAPVPAPVMARFLGLLPDGAEVLTPYGATECLPVSCISSREVLGETAAETDRGAGVCVGAPVPSVDVRIIGIDDGAIEKWREDLELPQGAIGEITVRGPQATHRYRNRPEETARAKIRDADGGVWHRMGDVGYFDPRGRLWFCGRKADRVETAAGSLHSVPCEAVFDTHPKVRRTALVGVPGPSCSESGPSVSEPVICVETLGPEGRRARTRIASELREIGARHPHTAGIEHFLFHRGFPVDIRHNAKIGRPALARWARRRLGLRLRRTAETPGETPGAPR